VFDAVGHERLRHEAQLVACMWKLKDRLPDLEPVDVVAIKVEGRWPNTEIVVAQDDQRVVKWRGDLGGAGVARGTDVRPPAHKPL
jgi:hypothetical protein